MLYFFQTLLAVLVVLIILPQTPTENILLRKFHETGIFTNYSEAQSFLNRFTWCCIFIFLTIIFF
jgi:protein translocase SecG subunit